MIKYFYNELSKIDDFSPGEKTNKIFGELCDYCVNNDFEVNIDNNVLSINKYCSTGEYELEKYYSSIIAKSKYPQIELKNFIYYQNYYRLTKLEYLNFKFYLENLENILFIGGGPLPLSSIILAMEYGVKSKIVDCSKEAVMLSKNLVRALGLENMIDIVESNAFYYKDNYKYDVCCIASLVFLGGNNNSLLENIYNLNFNLLLTRTSSGSRELMYKKIDKNSLKKLYDIQAEVHPKNDIINSFILSIKK